MKELSFSDILVVSGGSAASSSAGARAWQFVKTAAKVSAPVRAVVSAGALGWAVGTAIHNTFEDEIGAAVDYVFMD